MQDWEALLKERGIPFRVVRYTKPARGVDEIAAEEGFADRDQAVKAMAVLLDQDPAIVLLPGSARLNLEALSAAAHRPATLFPVDQAEATFGLPIAALTPVVCAAGKIRLLIDGRVLDLEEVSIASGDPMAGFRLLAEDLPRLAPGAEVVDLAAGRPSAGATIQPRLLRGFRDYLPDEMIGRQRMINRIATVFESFGFAPLQTPALEYSDILLGKYGADAEKLLYRFRDNGARDICLRYDLTVPLARLAAQYPDLPKPLKRYQIAPVWRAEKPGRGRFREFVQCDADVVGSASLLFDAECVALDNAVMRALGIVNFQIRVSTRTILSGLSRTLGLADERQTATVFRTIDKLASQGVERVRRLLADDAGLDARQTELVLAFVAIDGANEEKLRKVAELLKEAAEQPVQELRQVLRYARLLGVPEESVAVDFSIARGLDYYTGTVYETFLTDLPGFGSVMSGGRYDKLITRFLGKDVPAVGISVGIDRLFAGLVELGVATKSKGLATAMVAAYSAECVEKCLDLVRELRAAGVSAETAFEEEKSPSLKNQLRAGSRRGVPYVLILGPSEIQEGKIAVKEMASGQQTLMPWGEAIERMRASAGGSPKPQIPNPNA
ncbi:MAG: histidine--tRNA ligase [Planctomycetes bacterium]|nr:histidine--tRNA ligase [Planctomycetota bacterium]